MGIRGLTTYISNRSHHYLEDYELHDTYLVIDGNSIRYGLYMKYASNCVFGGDYGKYAQCVSDFFNELLQCNIIPLVLIDGGWEDNKLETITSRIMDKIQTASNYDLFLQHKDKFFPLFIMEVFKDVMDEKKIKYAQCIFEADNTIAATARLLNCPVLSFDSDFYIYGSLYISLSTWESNVIRNPTGNGYMKRCKIYNFEKFFQVFKGLNHSLLSLAAILLGNDYMKQHTFRNFFHHLELSETGRLLHNDQQRRIDATFNWLSKHSLNEAIIAILSRLRMEERKRVLDVIETMINHYVNASCSMSPILDILLKDFSEVSKFKQDASNIYKFEGNIYNFTYIEEICNRTEISNEETDEKEIIDIFQEMKLISNKSLVKNLPKWFLDEYNQGKFPSYFINMIIRKLYVCPVQIEDHSYASSTLASMKIISVIYGLLISEIDGNKMNMRYMIRGENEKINYYQLEYSDNILGYKLPTLSNLRELSIMIRRKILNITLLGIVEETNICEIPSEWILYLATIKYWIDQQQEPVKFNCHIYSLLFAMLLNIVNNYRNITNFQQTRQHIQHTRIIENYQPSIKYPRDTTLPDAIHEVNVDDCSTAAIFFMSNFEMDQKLYEQSKRFNITIVHAFAEFQNCLSHSMNLNALLGCPYEQTKVANFFNGTLLYNLCTNFEEHNNVEAYINSNLQNSPSLLQLFNLLLLKVKSFGILMYNSGMEWNKVNKYKKRTKCCMGISS